MKITRKDFLNVAVGAATLAAISSSAVAAQAIPSQPISSGKPKRGVSVYSWAEALNVTMTAFPFSSQLTKPSCLSAAHKKDACLGVNAWPRVAKYSPTPPGVGSVMENPPRTCWP